MRVLSVTMMASVALAHAQGGIHRRHYGHVEVGSTITSTSTRFLTTTVYGSLPSDGAKVDGSYHEPKGDKEPGKSCKKKNVPIPEGRAAAPEADPTFGKFLPGLDNLPALKDIPSLKSLPSLKTLPKLTELLHPKQDGYKPAGPKQSEPDADEDDEDDDDEEEYPAPKASYAVPSKVASIAPINNKQQVSALPVISVSAVSQHPVSASAIPSIIAPSAVPSAAPSAKASARQQEPKNNAAGSAAAPSQLIASSAAPVVPSSSPAAAPAAPAAESSAPAQRGPGPKPSEAPSASASVDPNLVLVQPAGSWLNPASSAAPPAAASQAPSAAPAASSEEVVVVYQTVNVVPVQASQSAGPKRVVRRSY